MSDDNVYSDGDIVWVKLGNNWWPGEVTDVHRQPDGLLQHLKRKPYCVVKFFQEDTYEYVKSTKQIFPFQCQKKEEFIKKGLALYNAKNKFMEKFPSDVKVAESLTRKSQQATTTAPVDTLIINNRPDSMVKAILGQATVRDNHNVNSFNARSGRSAINGNSRRESITILNITSHRGMNTAANYSPSNAQYDKTPNNMTLFTTPTSSKFTPPISRLTAYNSNVYSCNLCNFTSTRQNVMIFHRKTHSTPTPISKAINTTKTETTVIVTSTATTPCNNKPITITAKTTNVTPIERTPSTSTTATSITTKLPAISKPTLETTTPLSTITRAHAADAGGIVLDATKQASIVATKQYRGRGRRQRRSRQTKPTTAITTSEDEVLSCDDASSIRTDSTALSPTNTNNTASNGSVSQLTNRTAETIATPTSLSKGNSEELRQRLLADWSDEDNMDEHERTGKDKSVKSKIVAVTKDEDTNANNPKMATPQANTVVDDNNSSGNSNSNSACSNKVDKSLTRIRNIPKKDRRDVILTEFNSERNKNDNIHENILHKDSIETVAIIGEVSAIIDTPTTTKTDTDKVNELFVELDTTKETPKPFIATTTTTTTVAINDNPATKMSCFDFREDDDEEDVTNDALNSIANFKKKFLSAADKVTNLCKENKREEEDEETNKKDNELSAEIENLLQQTHTTVSDVNAFQNVTNTKHTNKKEDVTASVKGLPIKERGKRIFKSRNHARENCEPLLAANQLQEEQKIQTNEVEEETPAITETLTKEEQEREAVSANGEECLVSASSEKIEHVQALECAEEEEVVIPVVKHSPMEIYRSASASTTKSTVENEEVNEENSSISEADAVFGSPTSMLDDDRLPLIKEDSQPKKIEEKDALPDDEEEIESPPHEELSGNELEAEIQRVRKRTLTKTQRTPTPKKQILKQQKLLDMADNEADQCEIIKITKETENDNIVEERISQEVISNSVTNLQRKRRAPVNVTSCRRTSENSSEAAETKDVLPEIVPVDVQLEQSKEEEPQINLEQPEEQEIIEAKRRKNSETDNSSIANIDELRIKCAKTPINQEEKIEIQEEEKCEEKEKIIVETEKHCKVLLHKLNIPISAAKEEPNVPDDLIHANEMKEINETSIRALDSTQEQPKNNSKLGEKETETPKMEDSISEKVCETNKDVEKPSDSDAILLITTTQEEEEEEQLENKKDLIDDVEIEEPTDIIEEEKLQNSKMSNSNNKTISLSVKINKQSEKESKPELESKVVTTNGNNGKQQMDVSEGDENMEVTATTEIIVDKQQKSVWNATKTKSMAAAAATGGRKHAGHRIGLSKTYKLHNKNEERQPKQKLFSSRRRPSSKTQSADDILSAKFRKTARNYNVTMAQKHHQQQLQVLEHKVRKCHTPDMLNATETSVSQSTEKLVKITPKELNKEEIAIEIEEIVETSTDVQKTVTAFKLDESQVVQMQTDEQQMESPAKILAVPSHPLVGYNETFVLCTLVNNHYKPIDNVPLYLDHDLNQLVPVPMEALEGQSDFIVNPIPADSPTSIQQSAVKAILPESENIVDADTDVYDEVINENENDEVEKTSKEVKVMSLPTNVSDMMAEAAAAAVSTVMTPALVHGNQSNLQLTTSVTTGPPTETTQPAFMLLPDGEESAASTTIPGVGNEIVAGHAIIISIEGQQIIIDPSTFAQLLANPDANTQLITDDGTEFVLTREVLTALEAQHALVQTQSLMGDTASNDILAVALAGSDLYGSDMLEIETSQGLQLVCSDGNLGFQTGAHLTPPITAQTSETNALLDQTPIMSTLEAPSSTTLSAVNAAAKLKSHELSPNSAADILMAAGDDIATPNLEDSLAVIGVTTQSSAIPTSLELPITVTNPAIAPKVSLPSMLQVPDALMQFSMQPSISVIAEGGTHLYNDSGS